MPGVDRDTAFSKSKIIMEDYPPPPKDTVKLKHREVTAQGHLKVRRVWKRTQISQSPSSALPAGLRCLAEYLLHAAPFQNQI